MKTVIISRASVVTDKDSFASDALIIKHISSVILCDAKALWDKCSFHALLILSNLGYEIIPT